MRNRENSRKRYVVLLFIIAVLFLLIFSFLFFIYQNADSSEELGSVLDHRITGEVIVSPPTSSILIEQIANSFDSSGDFNSIEQIAKFYSNNSVGSLSLEGFSFYGDYFAIGDSFNKDKGLDAGAVYIYKKNSSGGWNYYQKIYGSKITDKTGFGSTVSIYKNILVVGSSGDSLEEVPIVRDGYGNPTLFGPRRFSARYVFELDSSNNWKEFAIIRGNGPVSFFEDRMAIGYPSSTEELCVVVTAAMRAKAEIIRKELGIWSPTLDNDVVCRNYTHIGRVEIYKKENSDWTLEQTLKGSFENENFGYSVLFNKNSLFVFAKTSEGERVINSFELNSSNKWFLKGTSSNKWFLKETFSSPNPSSYSTFWDSASFEEDLLFIGASSESTSEILPEDYLENWDFEVFKDLSSAKEVAYKYNRPLLIMTGMKGACSHATYFFREIAENEEFLNYAKENRIVLYYATIRESDLDYSDISYGLMKKSIVGKDVLGCCGGIGTHLFKVVSPTLTKISDSGNLADALEYLISDSKIGYYKDYKLRDQKLNTCELGCVAFNYDSLLGTTTNGIYIPSVTDSRSVRVSSLSPKIFISFLESFFPTNYYKSLDPKKDFRGGAVYVYKKDSSGEWNVQQKIVPEEILAKDNFGVSLSVSGDYLVVGSSNFGTKNLNQGAFYIYKKSLSGDWEYMNQISLPDGEMGDYFGKEIKIINNLIFVSTDNLYSTGKAGVVVYRLFHQEFDTTAPVLTLFNHSGFLGNGVSLQLQANDEKGISSWRIGSNSNFVISQDGLITNKTSLSVGKYELEVFVNDSSNNVASEKVTIEIKEHYCGDGICSGLENCSSCSVDCTNGCDSVLTLSTFYEDEVKNYTLSWETISLGAHAPLEMGQSLTFNFSEKEYILTLNSFDLNKSKFDLYGSGNLFKTFEVGAEENYSLDLNEDGKYDIRFIYDSLLDETVYFVLEAILEESSEDAGDESAEENGFFDEVGDSGLVFTSDIGDEEDGSSFEGSFERDSNLDEQEELSKLGSSEKDGEKKNVASEVDSDFLDSKFLTIFLIVVCCILLILVVGLVVFIMKSFQKQPQKTSEERTPNFSQSALPLKVPRRNLPPTRNMNFRDRKNIR